MKLVNVRFAFCAVLLLALALPMWSAAHPSLYNIVGKVARSPEIQTITITNATGGTFKPSAGATAVAWNAPAYAVQAALGADPAIGRNTTLNNGQANVLVTGNPGGPYTLRYQGTLGTTNMATTDRDEIVPDGSGLEGAGATATAETSVAGGQPDITYTGDPTGALLPDDILRTVIPNDGHVAAFVESNGLAANGWLNLRFMPSAYRASMTEPQWLSWPMAQTGIQSHATCQGVSDLNTEANILAVQSNDTDPFWNYVPWQKTSSGLGDEPEQWIDVVQTATGVDLSALTTVDEFKTACEGEGGVYVPADNPSNPAGAAIAEAVAAAVAPLNALIADLEDQVDALTNRPLSVQLQARRSSGKVVAMVTGPLSEGVSIQLRIKVGLALRLGLPQVIDSTAKQLGSRGAVLVTLAPGNRAATRLSGRGPVDIVVRAVSGALQETASGTLRP